MRGLLLINPRAGTESPTTEDLRDVFSIGERKRLDEARLYVYAAKGWLPSGWEERSGERFTIDTRGRKLEAAVDGEPEELETPLELSIEPGALRVLVPRSPG